MNVAEMSNVTINETADGKVLEIQLTGKLGTPAYEQLAPVVERLIQQQGKIRVLVTMHDFHGWTAGGLWQDIKFDAKHFSHIEKIALVGETKWQRWMGEACKPFTTAKVRWFDQSGLEAAREWVAT